MTRLLGVLLVAMVAGAAMGAELTRTSSERGIKVAVTPLNLSVAAADTLDFRVVLDTHSMELNYDVARIAVLRDDHGNVYRASAWQGPSGGHHVSGVLRFAQAPEILKARPAYLELQLEDVGGVPLRTFRWQFNAFK